MLTNDVSINGVFWWLLPRLGDDDGYFGEMEDHEDEDLEEAYRSVL